jgi:hypothetical protein
LENFALEKSFGINYDALGCSASAALASPDCDCAVLPVSNRREIFQFRKYRGITMCPRPQWGQGWRKGGQSSLEARISTKQKIKIKVRSIRIRISIRVLIAMKIFKSGFNFLKKKG